MVLVVIFAFFLKIDHFRGQNDKKARRDGWKQIVQFLPSLWNVKKAEIVE